MSGWSSARVKPLQAVFGLVIAGCGWLCGTSCGSSNGGDGGSSSGKLADGAECDHDEDCASGACSDSSGVCESRCIPNGNACGPSDAYVAACCSGYCGVNGTCE